MYFRDLTKAYGNKMAAFMLAVFAMVLVFSSDASAQITISTISNTFSQSFEGVPGLISAISYLLGLVFTASAILHTRDHVESPGQVPIRKPVVRYIVGGMLFALPYVFATMQNSVGGGGLLGGQGPDTTALEQILINLGLDDDVIGADGGGTTINTIFRNIATSIGSFPQLLSALSYLGGLIIGLWGILKIKEHVDNPDQVKIQEVIIRILMAAFMFALPTILSAVSGSISGDGGFGSLIVDNDDLMNPEETGDGCDESGTGIGAAACRLTKSTAAFPALLTALSYIIGLVVIFWGLFKLRDHVLNPSQTSMWDGMARFIAGAAFLALPFIVYAVRNSAFRDGFFGDTRKVGEYNVSDATSCDGGAENAGLDTVLYCFVNDIFGPANVVITIFGVMAGLLLIMMGISRLLKSSQEGAKGPAGIGTIMTFVAGAALLSTNTFLKAFSVSMFDNPTARSFANLEYREGMSDGEIAHVHTVISAILMFMAIVGFVSFVRGIFIVRDVAEGSNQASMMAGMTHLVGGALAVNLGPLLTAVQATLGIAEYGITFS